MPETEHKPTPGEAIQVELDRLGWTHDVLARLVGRHRPEISNVIAAKRSVSPELAIALAEALGRSPEYWLELEAAHQLRLLPQADGEIGRRVRLYQLAPVRDMVKRGWIRDSKSDDEIEKQVCQFFGIDSIDDEPRIEVAARKAGRTEPLTPAQRAWCFRSSQLASAQQADAFDEGKFRKLDAEVRKLLGFPEEARKIPRLLAEYGIRFVIVEPLPGSRMDGAAFWLDDNRPVIALSARIDRIDSFWFTLAHELSHIRHRDSLSVDSNLVGEEAIASELKEDMERRADGEGSGLLIAPGELQDFILRVGPMYSKPRIIQFAHRIKVHPGIIVGQLQHRGEIGYSANREMLVKVRDIVTPSTITDGWGHTITP